jgi:hypothetical protein
LIPRSQGSNPEQEDRGQKQLCFIYHGVRIKLDGDLFSLLGQSAIYKAFHVRLQLKLQAKENDNFHPESV